jgi:hypothetical protein
LNYIVHLEELQYLRLMHGGRFDGYVLDAETRETGAGGCCAGDLCAGDAPVAIKLFDDV